MKTLHEKVLNLYVIIASPFCDHMLFVLQSLVSKFYIR